jgi:uncharacterized protein YecT (DUF1311 family)
LEDNGRDCAGCTWGLHLDYTKNKFGAAVARLVETALVKGGGEFDPFSSGILLSRGRTMRKAAALLASMLFSQAAFAETSSGASFDCHKASSPIEKVICSDAKLSALDGELGKKFAEMKQANPRDSKSLIEGQRKWLKTRVQQCSYNGKDELPAEDKKRDYVSCLQRLYEQRIKIVSYPELGPPFRESNVEKAIARLRTMDPQDLYNITTDENGDTLSELSCRFFEKDPAAASKTFASYFGSSMDGRNPLCSRIDIAERVPEVKTLLSALEPVWGSSTGCDGTMGYAFDRSKRIIRILAAVDPNPMQSEREIAPLDTAALGYTPDLKHWSQQGNWERRQYESLQPVLSNAQTALSRYYQTTFHVNESQAVSAAKFHIAQIMREVTEHSGYSSTPSYVSLCFDTNDLDVYLKSSTLPAKICPYGQFVDTSKEATLRRFLGLAIVNQYPIGAIKKLIADGAEMNQKQKEFNYNRTINDSPLMLAAPYPEVISLLLEAGADVNAQNAFGKTALMYAVQERNAKSVSLLLDAHADVNAKTAEDIQCSALKAGNRTPLMYAAWQSTSEFIKMLANARVGTNAKDTNGETAFVYLKRNESVSAEEKLELEKMLNPTPH